MFIRLVIFLEFNAKLVYGTLNLSLELFSIFAIRLNIVVSEMELNRIVNAKVLVINLHLIRIRWIPIYVLWIPIYVLC